MPDDTKGILCVGGAWDGRRFPSENAANHMLLLYTIGKAEVYRLKPFGHDGEDYLYVSNFLTYTDVLAAMGVAENIDTSQPPC